MKRFFSLLTTAFIIVGLFVIGKMLYDDKLQQQRREAAETEINRLTAPLLLEKSEIERKINDCEQQMERLEIGTATAEYVVSDLSADCYKEVLTVLSRYNTAVYLALSVHQFPDEEGCVTLAQAKELGGKTCYQYDENEVQACGGIEQWVSTVKHKAEDSGFSPEGAILFSEGTFRAEYAQALQNAGITIILHHGEDGHDLYRMEQVDGMVYAGAHWWWLNRINADKLGKAHSIGGNLVIEVGCPNSHSDTNSPYSLFESFFNHTEILFTDFPGMIAQQEENQSLNEEAADALLKEITGYEARCEEIDREIAEIRQTHRQ